MSDRDRWDEKADELACKAIDFVRFIRADTPFSQRNKIGPPIAAALRDAYEAGREEALDEMWAHLQQPTSTEGDPLALARRTGHEIARDGMRQLIRLRRKHF